MRQDYYFEVEPFEIYPEVGAYEAIDAGLAGETWAGGVNRQRSKNVRWVQSRLNQIMNLHLPIDGILGPATRSAIRSFQRRQGLPVDGIVGPNTKRALIEAKTRQSRRDTEPSKFEALEEFGLDLADLESDVVKSERRTRGREGEERPPITLKWLYEDESGPFSAATFEGYKSRQTKLPPRVRLQMRGRLAGPIADQFYLPWPLYIREIHVIGHEDSEETLSGIRYGLMRAQVVAELLKKQLRKLEPESKGWIIIPWTAKDTMPATAGGRWYNRRVDVKTYPGASPSFFIFRPSFSSDSSPVK